MKTILDLLQTDGIQAKHVRSDEWHSPCPFCGREDCFSCWPKKVNPNGSYLGGRGHCGKCGYDGDAVSYLRTRRSLSFPEAVKQLGLEAGPKTGKKIDNGGTFLQRKMSMSIAFLSLNKSAFIMLIALLNARKTAHLKDKKSKKTKPVFINEDSLEMPYATLKKNWHLNQQAVSRAIDELMAKGFIEIVHQGGLGEHDKARYALSEDYLRWTPGMPAFRTRNRDVRRGYQGQRLGATAKVAHKIIPLHTH
jgi:hypothetical protein